MGIDPVFDLPTPLVFAHRGGAGEVPESTELAFRHAVKVGVDVLELDLRLTQDGQIVVWHGPELDNVYVGQELLRGKHIDQVDWAELENARVVDPRQPKERKQDRARRILSLREFVEVARALEAERRIPWNIEIKGKIAAWESHFPELFSLINPQVAERKIVLAAVCMADAERLRRAARENPPLAGCYAFNLTLEEQLPYRTWMRLGLLRSLAADALTYFIAPKPTHSLEKRTLETSHAVVGERLVNEVHRRGGAVHAFLTPFPALSCGVDRQKDAKLERELTRLIGAGVDGIMTDYPERVVPVVRRLEEQSRSGSLPSVPDERGAPWFGAATVIVALCLLLLQSLLRVKGGWGVEDFLAWAKTDVQQEPFDAWGDSRRAFAEIYLIADSLIFVPVYIAFGFSVISALRSNSLGPSGSAWWHVLRGPLLVLAGVDIIENGLGLVRIASGGGWLTAAFVSALSLIMALRLAVLQDRFEAARRGVLLGVAAAIAVLFVAAFGLSGDCSGAGWLSQLGCGAHHAKLSLTVVAIGLLVLAGVAWLFDFDRLLGRATRDEAAEKSFEDRKRLRAAIGDVLLRSRYVILAIVLVGVLTAGMDQGRDVLYAMAASPFHADDFALAWLGSMAALVTLAIATAALEYTCWLWTRSVCQLAPASAGAKRDVAAVGTATPIVNGFARYWARALAFVPIVFFVALHARVIQDGAMSSPGGDATKLAPIFTVFGFGLGLIGLGLWLLHRHGDRPESDPTRYYSGLRWHEWCCAIGFWPEQTRSGVNVKYRVIFGTQPVYRLPLLLGAGLLLCRLGDVLPEKWPWPGDYVPSLSLAVVLFSVALWLCLFGWLSMLEVRQSVPWVGLLVILVGVMGGAGWTDNHVVWSAIENGRALGAPATLSGLRMLVFTSLVLAVVLTIYLVVIEIVRRRSEDVQPGKPRKPVWALLLGAFGLLLLTLPAVLWAADGAATSRPFAAESAVRSADTRPSLETALGRWLKTVCKASGAEPCASEEESIPVYFISTEGGGIRAAVWSAFALEHLAQRDNNQFLEHTFSISGVSGGAVGAAAFRACDIQARELGGPRKDCLERFAATDMLSPLLSAWLFEDVVARVLPTRWCDTPGCGILSRGDWFEQALENAAPALRRGLMETSAPEGTPHLPYLFLNATWVESGERAIASDLRIDWPTFPGAKDQLAITGLDLPLGTAAHNAARFPYINAIGSLHAPRDRCAALKAESTGHALDIEGASNPSNTSNPDGDNDAHEREGCGHLADGGYFDNSGGQTTLDVLRGLEACLTDPADPLAPARCDLSQGQRTWLRARLVPQVLMMRNDVDPTLACADVCPFRSARQSPVPPLTDGAPKLACPNPDDDGYHPDRPSCRLSQRLFIGVAGPALTLFNVSGIGANGRLPEARQGLAVRELRERMGGKAAKSQLPRARGIDLVPDGTLYPLGWHLSRAAIVGMWKQAETLPGPEGQR